MRGQKPAGDTAELHDNGGRLRLFTDQPLHSGARIIPRNSQLHYLLHVMRARNGDRVLLFNGHDGEWRCAVTEVSRRSCAVSCETQTRAQAGVPDLWLAFAPIKKTPAEFLTQKATELGVAALLPVITERTVARRVNLERLQANATEAAEQSDRLSVPEIREPQTLHTLLQGWPDTRRLLFCDEAGDADPITDVVADANCGSSWGVLTGPEGGFSPAERELIRAHPTVVPASLGPRIMRADTAALAALAVWQAIIGDWR
jgi:16S rRNA (uracil1498-N3)-methyltransferase